MSEEMQEVVTEAVADTAPLMESNAVDAWYWSNTESAQVEGAGDKPDYLQSKYNSVEAQAQAYPELAGKFGSFTGAPDEYSNEFLGEGFESDESFVESSAMLKEMGVNQEGFETLQEYQAKREQEIHDSYGSKESEMAELGVNADLRVGNVERYLKANLSSEDFEEYAPYVNSAGAVKLVEKLLKLSAPQKLPSAGGENPGGMTVDKLKELRYAEDANGQLKMSSSPDYKAYVDGEWEKYYGPR